MNNQEQQELNEKINNICFTKHNGGWFHPDGSWNAWLVDFLDPIKGLGLMGEYPIAKLREKYSALRVSTSYYGITGGIEAKIETKEVRLNSQWTRLSSAVSRDPTTALALAIGKLIDSQEVSNGNQDTSSERQPTPRTRGHQERI